MVSSSAHKFAFLSRDSSLIGICRFFGMDSLIVEMICEQGFEIVVYNCLVWNGRILDLEIGFGLDHIGHDFGFYFGIVVECPFEGYGPVPCTFLEWDCALFLSHYNQPLLPYHQFPFRSTYPSLQRHYQPSQM